LQEALELDLRSAYIEAQCLLQAVLQVLPVYFLAHPEQCLNDAQHAQFLALFNRRLSGEPVAYILGVREFYGLNLTVTPDTLIPRAETELLVEQALLRIPLRHKLCMLDLGTGSGAIALSIAYMRPEIDVVAVDRSEAALRVAQHNAQKLGLTNIRWLHSDWFGALHGEQFDLIVANPPYIAANDVHLTCGDLRFEPRSALVAGGIDGLDDIRHISAQSCNYLNKGGWLLLEHGYNQAPQVQQILNQNGFIEVFSVNDLAGIARVSGGEYLP